MKWYVIKNPRWKYANGKFIMKRGWGNGYVAISPSHCLYGKGENSLSVNGKIKVHGGLTYAQHGDGDYAPKNWWVFGFDTSHYTDNLENWPKERVIEETIRLFWQLLEIEWGGL
jgi:hypothetical protein